MHSNNWPQKVRHFLISPTARPQTRLQLFKGYLFLPVLAPNICYLMISSQFLCKLAYSNKRSIEQNSTMLICYISLCCASVFSVLFYFCVHKKKLSTSRCPVLWRPVVYQLTSDALMSQYKTPSLKSHIHPVVSKRLSPPEHSFDVVSVWRRLWPVPHKKTYWT